MSDFDYPRLAKGGFLLGATLFVVGSAGALVSHAFFEPTPGWLDTLVVDLEIVGLLLGFFSPIVFGIAMPLLE